MMAFLEDVGLYLIAFFEFVGGVVNLLFETVGWICRGAVRVGLTLHQMALLRHYFAVLLRCSPSGLPAR